VVVLKFGSFRSRSIKNGINTAWDLGIYAAILKSTDILNAQAFVHHNWTYWNGSFIQWYQLFYVTDWWEKFCIPSWLVSEEKYDLGGCWCCYWVSDMENRCTLQINFRIGYHSIWFQSTENNENFRKSLFKRATGKGAFNKLLGNVTIELANLLENLLKYMQNAIGWLVDLFICVSM
jgi:hypothetical protein